MFSQRSQRSRRNSIPDYSDYFHSYFYPLKSRRNTRSRRNMRSRKSKRSKKGRRNPMGTRLKGGLGNWSGDAKYEFNLITLVVFL